MTAAFATSAPEWYDRYTARVEETRLPKGQEARYAYAEVIHGVRTVGPVRPDVSWQAQANQGFDISHFLIDWEARRVTCPEGKTSVLWKPGRIAGVTR